MDYKEKYELALERARKLYERGTITESLGHVFPELCESEDERIRKWIINEIKIKHHNLDDKNVDFVDKAITWLEKQGEQKTAWRVEDMFKVQRICKYLDEAKKYYADITEVRECIDWLKSLRPQNTWKPSDEQLDALQYIYRNINSPLSDKLGWNSLKTLELMYQDLKKL